MKFHVIVSVVLLFTALPSLAEYMNVRVFCSDTNTETPIYTPGNYFTRSYYTTEAFFKNDQFELHALEINFLRKKCRREMDFSNFTLKANASSALVDSKRYKLVQGFAPKFVFDPGKMDFTHLVEERDENISVDEGFENSLGDIHQLIERSYTLTRRKANYLTDSYFDKTAPCPDQWICRNPLLASKGVLADNTFGKILKVKVEDDFPVSVAFKKGHNKNRLVIVFRGTQAGEKGFLDSDWHSNYRGEVHDVSYLYNMPKNSIMWHKGYTDRYLRMRDSLHFEISELLQDIIELEGFEQAEHILQNTESWSQVIVRVVA